MKELWLDYELEMKNMISYNYTPGMIARSTFFYLQNIGHFYCNKGYYTKREGYRSFLLIYTLAGKGYAKYRGKNYEIRKGQVLLMDCYDYQEYYSDKEELWEMKWIHFYGSSSAEYFNLIYNKFGPVINIYENHRIEECINDIAKLLADNDLQVEIKISRLLVDILTELLLSENGNNNGTDFKLLNESARAAIEFIEKNYDRNISLKDISAAACCSEYHFSRVFKVVTGYSPYEYLIKYRINKAKNLLRSSDMKIDEISRNVGFESDSNFIRTFKALEDITPLKYRKYW